MTSPPDLKKLLSNPTSFWIYNDLVKYPHIFISDLLKYKQVIILIRTSDRRGHWVSISCNPRLRSIYYFSSFGTIPDYDKEELISPSVNKRLQQNTNAISRILKKYFLEERGFIIRYNQYRYQDPADMDDNSCGLWCVLFLNSGTDEENFNLIVKRYCAHTGLNYKELINTIWN